MVWWYCAVAYLRGNVDEHRETCTAFQESRPTQKNKESGVFNASQRQFHQPECVAFTSGDLNKSRMTLNEATSALKVGSARKSACRHGNTGPV